MKNLMRLLGRNKNMRGWKKIWGMSVSAAPLKSKKIWDWIKWIKKKQRVCSWCGSLKQKKNSKKQ